MAVDRTVVSRCCEAPVENGHHFGRDGQKHQHRVCTSCRQHTKVRKAPVAVEDLKGRRDDLRCPDCGHAMVLRDSRYGPFYGCSRYPKCRSAHGAHSDGTPLGAPATTPTKRARMMAHACFDVLWKSKDLKRHEAYAWLAEKMALDEDEAHIGLFTPEQCSKLIRLVAGHYGLPEVQDG